MAKKNKIAHLETPSRGKSRGRTADVDVSATVHSQDINNKGKLKLEKMVDVNRGTGKPSKRGGKNRGDRRDTSKTYSFTAHHAARGNTPRIDVSTRKR